MGLKPSHPTKVGKAPAGKSAADSKKKQKVASLTKGKWMESIATEDYLQLLIDSGYLPQPTVAMPRSPVVVQEDDTLISERVLAPKEYERVSFIPFLLRGLNYPNHPFF